MPIALALLLALSPSSEEFERGKNAFGRGEYQRAIELLAPLAYPTNRLESEAEVVTAHRMLGVAHLFRKEPEEARREFVKLLELRPDFKFDPLLDPPQVVDFFNGVVKEQAEMLSRIEARKREAEARRKVLEEERARNAERVVVERRIERRSLGASLVPFGAGQFQNGQSRKGWLFFATETSLALVSAGTFSANLALYGLRPTERCLDREPREGPCMSVDTSDERISRTLTYVSVGTGALFWGIAVWGVVDAVRNFRREVPAGPEVERRLPAKLVSELAPVWTGDALGLAGRF